MEYVIIGMILFILATGTMWYRDAQVKNRLYEKLLKEFVAKLVACRVEVREGEFFLYNNIDNTFLAQGRTPREVELNLPKDGRIFVNEELNRDILLVLNDWYVLDTAIDKSVVNQLYAIKVYLNKPKGNNLLDKNYYLMRDLNDGVVHVYTRKARVEAIAKHLQEKNPRMLIEVTDQVPAAALARGLKKKQDAEIIKTQEPDSKDG